jgi:UDP-N-acetylglucosamine diphosphorylase/glucosamine-1-phosphate N-acetyltransferase
VAANPDLVIQDAVDFAGEDAVSVVDPGALLGRAEDLRVGPGVAIGPFVVLDARDGPIVLDEDARVGPHATLRGPLYAGPGSAILGGDVGGGTSIGRGCKVRGEVEQSVFQGFDNKAHDGFVGHSAIGAWVNLGAGTLTSDLKNTYGPVRVEGPEGRTETGLLKVGAFLGDHVKTGIGTLLTTGARIGTGCHLFGGRGVSPARLPDFTWYDGVELATVHWEPFERGLRAAMARRGRSPSEAELAALRALHAGRTDPP